MKQFCLGVIVAIGLTLPAFGQGVDPYIGTWKINLEKSTATFPIPKDAIITWTREGQDTIITLDELTANGPLKIVWTANYDGQPRPTTGVPNFDSSAFTRIGNTINMVSFKNGKVVDVAQYQLLNGDKTYTITDEGIGPSGLLRHFTWVWDRQ
jgi:hypothetical protein